MAVSHLGNKSHSSGNWISGAIKHPGGLHEALGVPKGEKIPASKLNKAMHSKDAHIKKMANFAKELKGFNK